jgi:hypothetical protein
VDLVNATLPATPLSAQYAAKVVANRIVAQALDHQILGDWEDYPEIGEHDWKLIEAQLEILAGKLRPQAAEYDSAYKLLADRAGEDA